MAKNYLAIGYVVTDAAIRRSGRVEHYGTRASRQDAVTAWLYTHKIHHRHAATNERGIGTCPKCGIFAIIMS